MDNYGCRVNDTQNAFKILFKNLFWFTHMCQVESLVMRKTASDMCVNHPYIEMGMSGILPLI